MRQRGFYPARSVVCASLGLAGGLSAEDHGGEPGIAECGREVVGKIWEDGGQPRLRTRLPHSERFARICYIYRCSIEKNYQDWDLPGTQRTSGALPMRDYQETQEWSEAACHSVF